MKNYKVKPEKLKIKIINPDNVLKKCYFPFDKESTAILTVFSFSENKKYAVVTGNSDNTVFAVLEIIGKDEDGLLVAEYKDSCNNPSPDEYCTLLSSVTWYEEYGFCKLHFFCLDFILSDDVRRLYFDVELYEKMKKLLRADPSKEENS